MQLYNEPVYMSVSDLNYNGGTTGIQISRSEFCNVKRFDGRFLRERCSETRYNKIKREEARAEYSLAIQKKYNVGPDWRNNRWFVEQVRPTLMN